MTAHEEDRAYRRGLVLGFTLAEIILLLLFCLLLLFAITNATKEADSAKPSPAVVAAKKTQAKIDSLRGSRTPDVFWREVELVYRAWIRAQAGVQTAKRTEQKILSELKGLAGPKPIDVYWREILLKLQAQATTAKSLAQAKAQLQAAKTRLTKTNQQLRQTKQETQKSRSARAAIQKKLDAILAAQQQSNRPGHVWPPIIILREAEGFKFNSGDARLTKAFEEKLRGSVVTQILQMVKRYRVDVIEIVGHTDEEPIGTWRSNLDQYLLPFLALKNTPPLLAGDNTGLGMARAAAVVRFLRTDPRLKSYKLFPLSSAQALDINGKLADGTNPGNVRNRRRIEIRLRRSNPSPSAPAHQSPPSPE